MTSLATLRTSPAQVVGSTRFVVDALSFANKPAGPCRLISSSQDNGVVRLTWGGPQEGSPPDFYFPYVKSGIGSVRVPKDAPNGTIVVTGAMNGCGLVVDETRSDTGKPELEFHHDADCAHLIGRNDAGRKTLLEVKPSDYMTRGEGAKRCDPGKGGAVGSSFQHHLISVRAGGLWTVLNFGVIVGPGQDSPVVGTFQDGQAAFLIV